MNKKKKTILIVALLLVVFIGSISYALWSVTLEQTDSNIVKTGCFTVDMVEQTDEINLPEEYPVTDAEGRKYSPFTFTIQNTCTIDSSYSVNLKVEDGTDLDVQYLKTVLDNEEPRVLTEYEKATNEEKYQLTTGTLRGASSEGADDGESVTYNLRLWLDENTPESEMSKTFNGKIVIESITTRASKVLATGDISATESDNVTYTLYEDGLLKISGTGATKSGNNILNIIAEGMFDAACAEASLDCNELKSVVKDGDSEIYDLVEILGEYDSFTEAILAMGEITQADLDAMGVTNDAQLVNVMFDAELNEANTTACIEVIKNIKFQINDLRLEEGITTIGSWLFKDIGSRFNTDLSSVNLRLPSTVTTVENGAFHSIGVNFLALNEDLKTMGEYSFSNTRLKNIPSTVEIKPNSFYGAIFTETVDFSGHEVIPQNAFAQATFEKGIVLSGGLKEIGSYAFNNSNLNGKLVIPNSVEIIKKHAFSGTEITSLKLPENDVYHGVDDSSLGLSGGVCSGCENLTEVIIPINVYNLMHGNIQDLIWGDTRYVPEGAKYIMPIKLSEYGEKYKIYSLMSTGYEELGAVTTINNLILEWQPE